VLNIQFGRYRRRKALQLLGNDPDSIARAAERNQKIRFEEPAGGRRYHRKVKWMKKRNLQSFPVDIEYRGWPIEDNLSNDVSWEMPPGGGTK